MPAPAHTHKILRGRFLLLIASGVVALIAGELACRVWTAIGGDQTPGRFLDDDPMLGWINRPGFDGRHSAEDFDVSVRFDVDGHRVGREPQARRPDHPLILAVGDSTTFGWGVEEGQTFVARLRDQLDADIENCAVTGYGSGQQLLALRATLQTKRPRLVLVTHTHNDIAETQHSYLYRKYKPRFVVEGKKLRLTNVPVPVDYLVEGSHLWRTLLKHLGRFEARELSAEEERVGRELVQHLYREMNRECRARGIKLAFVGLRAAWLRDFAKREAIPYLDLETVFAQLEQAGPVSFKHDPHWLPRTHAAIAVELAAFVTGEQLLEH